MVELTPQEALDYLNNKKLTPGFDYRDVWKQEHNSAFTVAKMMQQDLLANTRNALDQALREGKTFKQFAQELKPQLIKKGWWGQQEMVDPLTDEKRPVQLGSDARLKTIYQTNMRTARGAGQYDRIQRNSDTHPFILYELGPSREHREEHLKWQNLLLPVDDSFWQTHYPANGWGCNCRVRSVSESEATQLEQTGINKKQPEIDDDGLPTGRFTNETVPVNLETPPINNRKLVNKRTGEVEIVPEGIDPGWNYNPGINRTEQQAKQLKTKQLTTEQTVGTTTTPKPLHIYTNDTNPDTYFKQGEQRMAELLQGNNLANSLTQSLTDINKRSTNIMQSSTVLSREELAVAEQFQGQLINKLNQARAINTPAKLASGGKGAAAVRAASKRYPDDWTKQADQLGELYVKYQRGRGWALSLSQDAHKVSAFGSAKSKGKQVWSKGTGFIVTDESSTAAHEYAHRLQKALPELDAIFNRLHQQRTVGDKLLRLRDVTGNMRYKYNELTRKDGYYSPYMGREYAHLATGQQAAEVMTMAFEPLLGTMTEMNAKRLYLFMSKDSELLQTAIGLLFHFRP